MLISIDDMLFVYLPKILLAIFCGSLIGLERQLKYKPAGIKTYMLICTGATLFTMVGIAITDYFEPAGDPARVAAQIVTGVGFLGAGTIIVTRGNVKGLTSAAAIWMSAAIGMSIGIDLYLFSVVVTAVIIVSLLLLGNLEERIGLKGKKIYTFTIKVHDQNSASQVMELVKRSRGRCKITSVEKTGIEAVMTIECDLTVKEQHNFQTALAKLPGDVSYTLEEIHFQKWVGSSVFSAWRGDTLDGGKNKFDRKYQYSIFFLFHNFGYVPGFMKTLDKSMATPFPNLAICSELIFAFPIAIASFFIVRIATKSSFLALPSTRLIPGTATSAPCDIASTAESFTYTFGKSSKRLSIGNTASLSFVSSPDSFQVS